MTDTRAGITKRKVTTPPDLTTSVRTRGPLSAGGTPGAALLEPLLAAAQDAETAEGEHPLPPGGLSQDPRSYLEARSGS
jgi:hypothetical protein